MDGVISELQLLQRNFEFTGKPTVKVSTRRRFCQTIHPDTFSLPDRKIGTPPINYHEAVLEGLELVSKPENGILNSAHSQRILMIFFAQ